MRQPYFAVALLLAIGCASVRQRPCVVGCDGPLRIARTFSDLHVQENVGFFGTEIRVVTTDDPYFQVVVQFGECEFAPVEIRGSSACFRESNLILVNAETERDGLGRLEFTISQPPRFAAPSGAQSAATSLPRQSDDLEGDVAGLRRHINFSD